MGKIAVHPAVQLWAHPDFEQHRQAIEDHGRRKRLEQRRARVFRREEPGADIHRHERQKVSSGELQRGEWVKARDALSAGRQFIAVVEARQERRDYERQSEQIEQD